MAPFHLVFPVAILAGFIGAMSGMGGSYPDQALGETIQYKARRAYLGAPLMK